MNRYVTNVTAETSYGPTAGPSKRFVSSLTNWKSSRPVTPPPRDYRNKQEPIDSRDFQSLCGVQPLAAQVDTSAVYPNAKRKRQARSLCERPGKARKGNNHQPIFSTGHSDNEDVEASNATNGGRYEREIDRNLRQWAQEAAAFDSLDDPFVDTPPSLYNEARGSVTKSDREAYLVARLGEMEEKLESLQDSSKRMTRAQSQEHARLSNEYARLCAELSYIPLNLSPSTSSGLLPSSDGNADVNTDSHMATHDNRSESVYSPSPLVEVPHDNRTSLDTRLNTSFNDSFYPCHHNNTDSSFYTDSTDPSPSAPAIPLRTLQDFEDYHEYRKIEFERTKACMYQDAPKVHRQAREERLFLLLANNKRRVKKYWDPLSQRLGEMCSKRYIRLASRSPSDSAPGFYEKS